MSAKLAWIRSLIAQITFADQQQVIVAESRRAFTAETANLVNAHTICTNAWNLFTFSLPVPKDWLNPFLCIQYCILVPL